MPPRQLQVGCLGGGGAVVAYSAAVRTPFVGVGALELLDRLDRPFLERQRAVAVEVELGEAFRRGPSNSSASILPSLFLSARLNRFPRGSWGSPRARRAAPAAEHRCAELARGRRAEGRQWPPRWPRLPDQECAGHEQEGRRRRRQKNGAWESPARGDWHGVHVRDGTTVCQLRGWSRVTVPEARRSARPAARLPKTSAAASAAITVNGRSPGDFRWHLGNRRSCFPEQERARVRIAAMGCAIGQRPQLPGVPSPTVCPEIRLPTANK